jgi:hypothetical protein
MPTFTDPRADPGRRQFTALHKVHTRARPSAHTVIGARPEEKDRSMRRIAGKIVEKARGSAGQRLAVGHVF